MPAETRRSAGATASAPPVTTGPSETAETPASCQQHSMPVAAAQLDEREAAVEEMVEFVRTHPPNGVQIPERAVFDAVRRFADKHSVPFDLLVHDEPERTYFDLRRVTPESEDAILAYVREKMAEREALSSEGEMDEEEMHTSSSEDCRKDEELEAIRHEIAELEQEIDISKQYKIVDRLGEGTFSSVYKAIDCKHAFYDNQKWLAKRSPLSIQSLLQHSNSSNTSFSSASSNSSTSTSTSFLSLTGVLGRKHKRSSSSSSNSPYAKLMTARKLLKQVTDDDSAEHSKSKVYVALKRIYVTSSPQRIWNELDILGLLRNARNTAYLISAIRHEDQVIAVMPYEKHQDFRTYYRNMALWQMQAYLKCLFSALADCHDFGIMHRDVKPANFLFNINTNTGTLCDFGLAQRYHPSEWQGRCLHSQPILWANQFEEIHPLPKATVVHGEKLSRPIDTLTQLTNQKRQYDELHAQDLIRQHPDISLEDAMKVRKPYDTNGYSTVFVPNARFEREMKRKIEKDQWADRWMPVRRPPSTMKVGYMKPEFDKRPAIRANRAGTRGFRAPEVILKCPDQTMALDIWSVGVTILCLLTRRFPFFTSTDDTEALVEIAAIFGKKRMEKCAALHNRSFLTNLPCIEDPVHSSLHDLVRSLNPNIFVEAMPAWAREQYTPNQQHEMLTNRKYIAEEMDIKFWYNPDCRLYQVIELMRSCLALDLTRRITAADALNHPFLSDC